MVERVLVTGGAGYIGSILVPQLLAQGYAVTVFDSFARGDTALAASCADSRFTAVKGDVREEAAVAKLLGKADIVIPLAALVGAPLCARDPHATVAVNRDSIVAMTKKLSRHQIAPKARDLSLAVIGCGVRIPPSSFSSARNAFVKIVSLSRMRSRLWRRMPVGGSVISRAHRLMNTAPGCGVVPAHGTAPVARWRPYRRHGGTGPRPGHARAVRQPLPQLLLPLSRRQPKVEATACVQALRHDEKRTPPVRSGGVFLLMALRNCLVNWSLSRR